VEGEGSGGEATFAWGELLRKRLMAELPEPGEGRTKESLFEAWSQNTEYCFRLAEALVGEKLDDIASKAKNGQLDPRMLSPEEQELIIMYSRSQEMWQSVCLVLRAGSSTKAEEAVAINRPVALRMDERMAQLLLNGHDPSPQRFGDDVVARCIKAFSRESAVYLGGPERQGEPGLCVHGFGNLPGAREVAAGTRIFVGGEEAAIDGVLNGTFSPLDFRWFIGRHTDLSTRSGEWCAAACARPIALKQCLGLPKPLWHEVMELCGGESAQLSRLEFVKRNDLDDDDEEDEEEA